MKTVVSIDTAMELVASGGRIRTGVDVYDQHGILLLGREEMVAKVSTLQYLKENGLTTLPFHKGDSSGIWDAAGSQVQSVDDVPARAAIRKKETGLTFPAAFSTDVEKRLVEIAEIKHVALKQYDIAKLNIKTVLNTIKASGGEFDYGEVENYVSSLMRFLTEMNNPFAYLTKEILSYDDYLYNHSVNVCSIGMAILNSFNQNFSATVNRHIDAETSSIQFPASRESMTGNSFSCYFDDELKDIITGFFLHDMGKVRVPDEILNKPGQLTAPEFDLIKKHSSEYGGEILEKNRIRNSFLKNTIQYHHAQLYDQENRCYPDDRPARVIPIYVRICKLADIYDAMTSKRSYKEAFNQINVVTEIFRRYAKKDRMLQFVLHAFVKSIGIYPPGSIVYLRNGQMVYVLESSGPIVIPFTDARGCTLGRTSDPMDVGEPGIDDNFKVDNRKSVKTPMEVYDLLPAYLKKGASVQVVNA